MGAQQRREKARQDARQSILDAARDIISHEGFAALTMRKLAERVGYSAASLYMHFRNRDQIAKEISRSGYADLLTTLQSASGKDPAARFRALCRAYVRFGLENPQTYALIFMEDPAYLKAVFAEQASDDPATLSYNLLADTMQDLVSPGIRASESPPTELAETVWAALHGIVSLKLTCPAFPSAPAEVLTKIMTDTFLRGLAAPRQIAEPTRTNRSSYRK